MRRMAWVAVVFIPLAGVATAYWLQQPSVPAALEHLTEAHDEAPLLAASDGLVWRDGDTLNFRLKSGEILTLTDRSKCGDLPCPKELSIRYRYLGWDGAAGGYAMLVTPAAARRVILPFSDDDVTLVDARRIDRPAKPLPLPEQPAAVGPNESLIAWLTDITSGRNQGEAPAIAASHGRAARHGDSLVLTLTDGRTLVLTDDVSCGQVACPQEIFRSYDYVGASPDGRYQVVEEHWREANAALLIDSRKGGVSVLLGLPKFSPDGTRAIASVTDLEWTAPRRLEVWSLTGTKPSIEFSLSAKEQDDTVFEVTSWNDADHVQLRRGPWASGQRSPAMLAHDGSGWHLAADDGGN